MTTEFKIGCDPEVFVTKRGKPASAYGLLEGTKEAPKKTQGGAYQVDGMAAEFNTDPLPLSRGRYNWDNARRFEDWNRVVVSQIQILRDELKKTGHSVRISPTMEFGKEFLDKQPDEAKELGCDPDYSAYTKAHNPRPDGEQTFRTGAGHIHIGWGDGIPVANEEHIEICADFVKELDATIGWLMTFIDRDPKRRLLYGKAGAFRPKPYGVEYRTPSNRWLETRDTRYAIWRLLQDTISFHSRKTRCAQTTISSPLFMKVAEERGVWDDIRELNIDDAVRFVINEGRWDIAEIGLDILFRYESNNFWQRIKARALKEYGE